MVLPLAIIDRSLVHFHSSLFYCVFICVVSFFLVKKFVVNLCPLYCATHFFPYFYSYEHFRILLPFKLFMKFQASKYYLGVCNLSAFGIFASVEKE